MRDEADAVSHDTVGQAWPEQDAVEAWWQEHRHELKRGVTAYRLKLQAAQVEQQRQRDRLWCSALLHVLDTKDVERVLATFNRIRPDQEGA